TWEQTVASPPHVNMPQHGQCVRLAVLAACRTGVDFYVPAILLRIERLSLLTIIATIADGRRRKVSRHQAAIQASIESAQPRLSACIRLMFQAMVARLHSPRTQSSPRSRNWRNPITDLMMPNPGSGVCLRRAESCLPCGVRRRQAMASTGVGFSGAGGGAVNRSRQEG